MTEMNDFRSLFRKRLSEFQNEKHLSEVEMSLDLGKSNGYIQSISSGRNMPSFSMFTEICGYLNREPYEFFINSANTGMIREIIKELEPRSEEELYNILNRLRPVDGDSK